MQGRRLGMRSGHLKQLMLGQRCSVEIKSLVVYLKLEERGPLWLSMKEDAGHLQQPPLQRRPSRLEVSESPRSSKYLDIQLSIQHEYPASSLGNDCNDGANELISCSITFLLDMEPGASHRLLRMRWSASLTIITVRDTFHSYFPF